MKNLLIYISPTGSFKNPRPNLTDDAEALVKVQIDNSLALGWHKKDIMLVTNFSYAYKGVKAIVKKDIEFFDRKPQASKINAIIKLFEEGMIKEHELYWFHDLDAFQLEVINQDEIDIDENEIALTDFGGAKHFGGEDRWSGGIIYFKSGSADLFHAMQKLCYEKGIDEEEALGLLVINNLNIRSRVKKLDSSFNFIGYNLEKIYRTINKPIKVVHFHPRTGKKRLGGVGVSALKYFKGENPLHAPLLTKRFLTLLSTYGME